MCPLFFYRLTFDLSSRNDGSSPSSSSSSSKSYGGKSLLLHAEFAPAPATSSSATPVVFVEDGDVYYVADVGARRVVGVRSRGRARSPAGHGMRVFPVSPPGTAVPGVVTHGVPDWIYEGIQYY